MSLLDTASLVITPNGYKEGKLYSVVPSDGSGDLNVTRATTATRVNEAGLVELVPYNLLSYSEQLDNAYWSKYQATITANNTSAPNGSLTADKITQTGTGSATFYITSFPLSGGIVTLSCYYKKGTNNKSVLELNRTTQSFSAEFNLDTEVITATGNYVSTNMEDVGNGWFRCSVVSNQTAGTVDYFAFGNIGSNGTTLYAWGVQLNEGTIKDYQKTETRLNIPRLDYSNGTCPSILVEPQRTNLLTYSEQFDNAVWGLYSSGTGVNPIVTANTATSPSGVLNADTIVLNAGAGTTAGDQSQIFQTFSITNGNVYTFSFYAKGSVGGEQLMIRQAAGSSYTKITLTNQWERYQLTETASYSGTGFLELLIRRGLNEPINANCTFYAWGAQLEAGSYATSYIPTTSASVTRNADVISKTGISSLIGQTEGTMFVDIDFDGTGYGTTQDFLLYIGGGSYTNSIWIDYYNNNFRFYIYSGTTNPFAFTTPATNGRKKLAFGYKSGQYVAYINGTLVNSSTDTTTPPTCSMVSISEVISNDRLTKNFNNVALWKTRLTNTQLASLTSL